MKRRTIGVDPKVPTQLLATLVAGFAAYLGFDLSPELSLAIATVIGGVIAAFGPAATTTSVAKKSVSRIRESRGQIEPLSLLVYVIVLIILVILVFALIDHLH